MWAFFHPCRNGNYIKKIWQFTTRYNNVLHLCRRWWRHAVTVEKRPRKRHLSKGQDRSSYWKPRLTLVRTRVGRDQFPHLVLYEGWQRLAPCKSVPKWRYIMAEQRSAGDLSTYYRYFEVLVYQSPGTRTQSQVYQLRCPPGCVHMTVVACSTHSLLNRTSSLVPR